jgi:hypothetical protein
MRKAGDILSSFFNERLIKEGQKYSNLFKSWAQIAGDQLSAHSRIVELERNILIVEADHPGWIMILQSKEQELLERVRRSFPELELHGISFRLSRVTKVSSSTISPPEQTIPASDTSMSEKESTEVDYDRIQDPQFKEVLQRLERSIKSRYT